MSATVAAANDFLIDAQTMTALSVALVSLIITASWTDVPLAFQFFTRRPALAPLAMEECSGVTGCVRLDACVYAVMVMLVFCNDHVVVRPLVLSLLFQVTGVFEGSDGTARLLVYVNLAASLAAFAFGTAHVALFSVPGLVRLVASYGSFVVGTAYGFDFACFKVFSTHGTVLLMRLFRREISQYEFDHQAAFFAGVLRQKQQARSEGFARRASAVLHLAIALSLMPAGGSVVALQSLYLLNGHTAFTSVAMGIACVFPVCGVGAHTQRIS